MKINFHNSTTTLEPEELADLIPTHIKTQADLNAWEERNILLAHQWAYTQKDILSVEFIKKLHKHMFNQTWLWAGEFRSTAKNIGIDWYHISPEIKKLCDDVTYWLEHKTHPIDEIAMRFHHRLVWIHPFPNGNGRHARLITDLLLTQQGQVRFSWGKNYILSNTTPMRKLYIEALQSADRGDYSKLIDFVRN